MEKNILKDIYTNDYINDNQPSFHDNQPIFDSIEELIGLHEVKKMLKSCLNYHTLMQIRKQNGMPTPKRSFNIAMLGNPGTGKTSVARLLGKEFKRINMLSRGHVVEVNRELLTDSCIGGTEKATMKYINEARGGILFIDECYSLTPSDPNDRDFGKHVIDTLMPILSEPDNDLICIFAGYPKEVERFLQCNAGLSSRVSLRLHFPDYSVAELIQIAEYWCQKNEFTLTREALVRLATVFEDAKKTETFGNGRFVKTFLENQVVPKMAERVLAYKPIGNPYKLLTEIKEVDVEIPNPTMSIENTQRIKVKGFRN